MLGYTRSSDSKQFYKKDNAKYFGKLTREHQEWGLILGSKVAEKMHCFPVNSSGFFETFIP